MAVYKRTEDMLYQITSLAYKGRFFLDQFFQDLIMIDINYPHLLKSKKNSLRTEEVESFIVLHRSIIKPRFNLL